MSLRLKKRGEKGIVSRSIVQHNLIFLKCLALERALNALGTSDSSSIVDKGESGGTEETIREEMEEIATNPRRPSFQLHRRERAEGGESDD